jgi:DMSO/TMAO reductase YedYZ heme-binding membrane subunit
MRLVAGIVLALLIVTISGRFIKRAAPVFYIVALILDVFFIYNTSFTLPPWFREYILFVFQSNNLAMGFFIIVMFTGVLNEKSALRKFLMSIRAELSIIASIFTIGHVIVYGRSYLAQITGSAFDMPAARLVATLVAFLLVVLLIPLTLTSIRSIKARMKSKTWKNIQKTAYVFFLLIFIHIFFYLLPPALAGSLGATVSLVLYSTLCLAYLILRIRLTLQHSMISQTDMVQESSIK